MNTTYDMIWQCFYDNCGVDHETLPQTDEGKYILIKSGTRHYNTVVDPSEDKIVCDDMLEEINIELDETRLTILAFCMRYRFLENELIQYEQTWQPFSNEVGQKFYNYQIQGRETTLEKTKQEIIRLLTSIDKMSYLE